MWSDLRTTAQVQLLAWSLGPSRRATRANSATLNSDQERVAHAIRIEASDAMSDTRDDARRALCAEAARRSICPSKFRQQPINSDCSSAL